MKRVAILDDYQGLATSLADWGRLEARAEIVTFRETLADHDALVERLDGFEVICAMRERTRFDAALLGRLPRLRLLVTTGMRNASIDMEAAAARGIVVCGTGGSGHATAELAFALVLMLARNLRDEVCSVRDGGWQVGVGRDLAGACLGVVGLGRLGGQLARYGAAFGMDILAWSENLTAERCAEVGARLVAKRDLFARADYVSLHLRLSDRTRHIVGAGEIAAMRPEAFLVNTSRAELVDGAALRAALAERRIAGAALDVYEEEPLPPEDAIRSMPNVLATPHIGYVSRATYEVFYRETVEDIEAWLDGRPIRVLNDQKP